MYIPKKFEQNDPAELKQLMRRYPFATLITHGSSGLEANHLPFFLNEEADKVLLQGHIAKANPLWKSLEDNCEVLVVFHGPNTYISPNYYPSKQQDGKVVPTWNYLTVHAKGRLSYVHDESWNRQMINNLTQQHEAAQAKPWSVNDAPEDFTEKMLKAIVGIEIEVTSMVGKWKASQNQSEQNQRGVVEGLSKGSDSGAQAMAAVVGACAEKA